MAVSESDKTLIASSEFDASQFVRGIDLMAAALETLARQENAIQTELKNIDAALKQNRNEYRSTTEQITNLDKSSKTYKADLSALTAQKKLLNEQAKTLKASMTENKTALESVNKSATTYKTALQAIATTSKKVSDENRGRQLFDVTSLSEQVTKITQASAKIRDVFKGKISTAELDKFEDSLASANDEFIEFARIIDFVKQKMDTLDPESEEFAELTRVVQVGEEVLDAYGKTLDNTGKRSGSLKSQLRALTNELAILEDQGKENTDEFLQMSIQAGRLQDQIGDTQERIKFLASDTRALDFGLAAIRGVAAGFGIAEGAAALFGAKNQELAESLQRLNAIMVILNGLTEVQNLLKKQSPILIGAEIAATKAAAIAQRVYAVAVGTSTGAMKAFRVALLATGIGIFIVALGFAAEAMGLFEDKTEDATDANEEFKRSLADLTENLNTWTRIITENAELQQLTLERQGATEQELSAARIKALQEEQKLLKQTYNQIRADQQKFLDEGQSGDVIEKANEEATRIAERSRDIDQQIRVEKEKTLNKTIEDNRKANEKRVQLERDYLDRLTELQREFRDKTLAAQPQDEQAIRQQFANSLNDQLDAVAKDVKLKKLTEAQGANLATEIRKINTLDLREALTEFRTTVLEVEEQLSTQLFELRIQNGTERAELIREQFTREAAIINIEARNRAAALKRDRDQLVKSIEETPGLLPTVKKERIEQIQRIYEQLLENLTAQTTRKQEEISNRIFETSQNELKAIFEGVQLTVSETATREIEEANQKLIDGTINYDAYQKELTAIANRETDRRIATSKREAEALLSDIQKEIAAIKAKPVEEQDQDRLRELEARERALLKQIDDLKRELALAQGKEVGEGASDFEAKIAEVGKYAQAIGGIISQVVGFWAAANEAERKSLEQSIALQQERVDAATRLAEKGNAEFLRLEEDRLNELQVKQENAARRQIAINAVLQTSQALVAFTTALAQAVAAPGPLGVLGGIAIASAVLAAIASGYAIIQSLQPQTPSFFKGEKYVSRKKGEPPGRDTIPAMLNEGEAVIPTDTNREYKPTVAAIFDKKIPPEVINNFVNNYYRTNKTENKTTVNPYSEAIREIRQKGVPVDRIREFVKQYNKTERVEGIDRGLVVDKATENTVNTEKVLSVSPAEKGITNITNLTKKQKAGKTELVNNIVNNLINEQRKRESSIINNYPANNRSFPQLDNLRMSEAAEVYVQRDGELLQATKDQTRTIKQNNELLQNVEDRLKRLEFSVRIDRNGLAVSLMKMVEKYNIEKRS